MSSRRGEGVGREVRGRRDIGQGFGQGVGHLNYLAVPGVGIFEFFFRAPEHKHFPGWGIQLY